MFVVTSRRSLRGERVGQRGHDQKNAVATPGPRFGDLVGVEHEILAQRGQRSRSAGGSKEFGRALERWRIGED